MEREPQSPPVDRYPAVKPAGIRRKGKAPANGTQLYFERTGAASGLPLVLIPDTGRIGASGATRSSPSPSATR